MKTIYLLIALISIITLTGCQSDTPKADNGKTDNFIACEDPRPTICTEQYEPVCAQKDTGVRCVTTPCDSTEPVTASNACTACSDPDVHGYVPGGECKESPKPQQ